MKGNNVIIQNGVVISASGGAGATGITNQNGGAAGGGGRVFIEGTNSFVNQASSTNANITANGGQSAGTLHGSSGSVKILRPQVSSLNFASGSLTIDTDMATIVHSDGSFLSGTLVDKSFSHTNTSGVTTVYPYKVCVFTADTINLGSNLVVTLQGSILFRSVPEIKETSPWPLN